MGQYSLYIVTELNWVILRHEYFTTSELLFHIYHLFLLMDFFNFFWKIFSFEVWLGQEVASVEIIDNQCTNLIYKTFRQF